MKDISDWLIALGMFEYIESFVANGIDVAVLPDLTDQDLKELGVVLGHRRKILRAIAERGASASSVQPTISPDAAPTASRDAAERRQLTVMFCDLVGSTALSARLDPEDMREIIGAYHACCAALIGRHGGFVAKYMGDGVLAYFGYPSAHEHDAERAVQAGLALVAAVPQLVTAAGAPLHVRVGIATGIVVVGDLVGVGESQERGIVGDTPNLAARLQGVAVPDSVVIADGTRRLLGDLFELSNSRLQELKGIAAPARTWTVLRANTATSRFEAMHASGLTPLVGREEECELLLRRWASAKVERGQVVLITGEAGIGKSRLAAALMERLSGEPHTRMRYFCSPQHGDSALYPIIGHLERAAGFTQDDPPSRKLEKLKALLAHSSSSLEDFSLLADLLSLPEVGRLSPSDLTPQQQRHKTMQALLAQIEALAHGVPVLMIFEDAHWADPTSLELLGRLIDRIASLRVLLFVTYRPEFTSPWVGRSHVTALTINRLAQDEVAALIDRLAGDNVLAANVQQDIVERADGIPLFVEEMTKAVLEAQMESGAERAIASIPAASSAVPASLHASLMARLDRLGRAKTVAQIGAAIGREFSHALLAMVADENGAELELALDRLVDAGLLFRHGAPPHATYLFNHALVQDAAYGTLLREPRRVLHARIAEAIETYSSDVAEARPELLARHYTEAGLIEKAASLWGKAGQQSLARSSLMEAEAQLTRALALMDGTPATPALRREQIKLQVGLSNALTHTRGYGTPETQASFTRARSLIEQAEALGESPEDPLAPFSVLYGLWAANYTVFNRESLHELVSQFQAQARRYGRPIPIMLGHRVAGVTLLHEGELTDARAHFDCCIGLYNPLEHKSLRTQFGQDSGVSHYTWRSWALWLLGYPDAAITDACRALNDARDTEHAPSLMFALSNTQITLLLCGNYRAAKSQAEELVSLAEEKGALLWKALGTQQLACSHALLGEAEKAVQLMSLTIDILRGNRATVRLPYYLLTLASAQADLKNFREARLCIHAAQEAIEMTGERWCEAAVHQAAGEIELLSPEQNVRKVQSCFEQALKIARNQNARSYELRAATSLARLYRDQGRLTQARHLLEPVYGWFTQGFGTCDLKQARAVLDELGSHLAAQ